MKRMNLLPKELRPPPKRGLLGEVREFIRKGQSIGFLVMVVGGVVSGWVMQGAWIEQYRSGNAVLRKELRQIQIASSEIRERLQDLNVERADLGAQQESLRSRLKALQGTARPGKPFSHLLAELAGLIPEEIWISKLSYAGKKLKIVGSSQATAFVTGLMARMDESRWFRETTFVYTQRDAEDEIGEYRFEITTALALETKETWDE